MLESCVSGSTKGDFPLGMETSDYLRYIPVAVITSRTRFIRHAIWYVSGPSLAKIVTWGNNRYRKDKCKYYIL